MFDQDKVIAELNERNRLRLAAKLPALPLATELARAKAVHEQSRWDEYVRANGALYTRIWDRKIKRIHRFAGNANYDPKGWARQFLHLYVMRVMGRIYRARLKEL